MHVSDRHGRLSRGGLFYCVPGVEPASLHRYAPCMHYPVLLCMSRSLILPLIVFLALVPSAQTCDPVPSRPGGRVEGVCGTRRSNKTGVLYSVQSNPYLVHTSNIVSTEKKKEKKKERKRMDLLRLDSRSRPSSMRSALHSPISACISRCFAVCQEMYVRSHRASLSCSISDNYNYIYIYIV